MSLAQTLRAEARTIVESVRAESQGLAADLLRAEQAVSDLKAKIGNRLEIQRRLSAYSPEAQRDPNCPYCWLMNGVRTPVTAFTPVEKSTEGDYFKCRECESEFIDPAP